MKFNGGFSTDKAEMVPLPATFFRDVLPDITNLSELKVTLHIFWLLSQRQTFPRCVSLAKLEADHHFMQGLRTTVGPSPAQVYLEEGLELATARGTLLEIVLREEEGAKIKPESHYYLINTARNRRLISELQEGNLDPQILSRAAGQETGTETDYPAMEPLSVVPLVRGVGQQVSPVGTGSVSQVEEPAESSLERTPSRATTSGRVEIPRPNIYGLYEQNIGLLNPLIAEQLSEAEQLYPEEWIIEAFREAVSLNKRNWRYIQRILENWATRGKDDAKDRRNVNGALDPDKYKKGKYAHLFRRE